MRAAYLVRTWDFETGSSIRSLNCLWLGRDGFLWLGTKDGLARFDGVQFTPQPLPDPQLLRGNNVTALWESPEGRFWLGCESGDLYCWDRAAGTVTTQPQHWPTQPIRAIAADGHGDVWITLASHDLVRARDGWLLRAPPGTPVISTVQRMLLTSDGRLYQQCGFSVRLQGGTRDAPAWQDIALPDTLIVGFAPSHLGLWIVDREGRVRLWNGNAWIQERARLPAGTPVNRMLESSTSDLFIGTLDQGLLLCPAKGPVQHLTGNDPENKRIVDIVEDGDGNILAGSDHRLSRLRASTVQTLASPDNWGGSQPISVTLTPDGARWIGTEGSGLFRLGPDGGVTRYGEADGLTKAYVWSLLPDQDGGLWVGTWGGGLFHGINGKFSPVSDWGPTKGWAVPALFRDASGTLWAGTNLGLWRRQNGGWSAVLEPDGTPVVPVRTIEQDAQGRVWLGTNGHGLKVWENDRIHTITPESGLPARFISALRATPSGGLWAGTLGDGLYRWDGQAWSHLDQKNGLPANDIFHIAADPHGQLWFTSPAGVFTLDNDALAVLPRSLEARVRPWVIDQYDGLPSSHCSSGTQSAACMTVSGEFVVPTFKGVAVIPTDRLAPRQALASAAFTTISVDDTETAPGADGVIRIPPGIHRVAVGFTAPAFGNPERIHFRYQLQGLDHRWMDLGPQRSILFSHLPAGDYRLQVLAANPDGRWNPRPAELALSIAPYFWETTLFRLLAAGLLVGTAGFVVWFIMHRRTHRKLRHLEAAQAVEQERRRIARDIHDELGAPLTRIMMLSQSSPPAAGSRPPVGNPLPSIHTTACEITKAMDELVWTTDPSHDTLESFAAYSARTTQDLVHAAGLLARLSMPEQFPDIRLDAGPRHHLLMILKEALTNALRHAHAREITLTLAIDAGRLRLELKDDGRGMPPETETATAARPTGGHGLSNLRRRAAALGGTLTILSAPGQGCRLRVVVPLPPL